MKLLRPSLFSIIFLSVFLTVPINQILAQELCEAPCEFRFAVYGDSRSDHDIHRDIVARGIYDSMVKGLKSIGVFPSVGNHDIFAYSIADVFPNEIVLTTYSSRQPSNSI